MRVCITRKLTGSIDGIQLDQFEPGYVYDVGTSIGCYLMAIAAVEPLVDDASTTDPPPRQRLFASEPLRVEASRASAMEERLAQDDQPRQGRKSR